MKNKDRRNRKGNEIKSTFGTLRTEIVVKVASLTVMGKIKWVKYQENPEWTNYCVELKKMKLWITHYNKKYLESDSWGVEYLFWINYHGLLKIPDTTVNPKKRPPAPEELIKELYQTIDHPRELSILTELNKVK